MEMGGLDMWKNSGLTESPRYSKEETMNRELKDALERVEEYVTLAHEWLDDEEFKEDLAAINIIKSALEDYEKAKAEVEAMKPSCLTCFGSGKIQTHPTVVCPKCGGTGKEWSVAWKARAEKAEAELARWKPLIGAVEKAKLFPAPTDGHIEVEGVDFTKGGRWRWIPDEAGVEVIEKP